MQNISIVSLRHNIYKSLPVYLYMGGRKENDKIFGDREEYHECCAWVDAESEEYLEETWCHHEYTEVDNDVHSEIIEEIEIIKKIEIIKEED